MNGLKMILILMYLKNSPMVKKIYMIYFFIDFDDANVERNEAKENVVNKGNWYEYIKFNFDI